MIVILLIAACNGNSDNNNEQRSITVLPFQSPCFTMEQTLCLVTKTGASDQTNMIANEIIGFEFKIEKLKGNILCTDYSKVFSK